MARSTDSVWTLGGLSLPDLLRRTVRESWQDEVFGQAGRMAFYHFIAIFRLLLVFLSITTHIPRVDEGMKRAIQDMSNQVLPNQVSQLLQAMIEELSQHAHSRVPLLPVLAGAAWAALKCNLGFGFRPEYRLRGERGPP